MAVSKKEISKVVGLRIKEARKEKNYTQEYIAEKIGLSPDQYRNIENGRSFGSIPTLLKICNHLKITFDELFFDFLENKEEITDKQIYTRFQELATRDKEIVKIIMKYMD